MTLPTVQSLVSGTADACFEISHEMGRGTERLDGYIMPIELPSWSIFIRFKKFRDWGFHLPEGLVQWNKFWQDKCE